MRLFQTCRSIQYGTLCVIAPADASADDIIANCREIGAVYREDGPDDECFVVDVQRGVGPELYTESALRRGQQHRGGKITPGKWWASPYSSVVGIAIMAQPDPAENAFMVCAVRGRTREECEANAAAILAAIKSL